MAEGRPAPITLDHFSEMVVASVTRAVTSNNSWRDKIIRMGGRFEVFVEVPGLPQEGLPSGGGTTINR
jgi:hypothetical protein